MPFQVTPTTLVRDLKTQIQRRCHVPPDTYFLTLRGAILDDHLPLGAYRISTDAQIQLRHCGPGGMMPVPQAFQHWQQVDSFTEDTPTSFPPPPPGLDLHQHTPVSGSQDDHPYMDPQDANTPKKAAPEQMTWTPGKVTGTNMQIEWRPKSVGKWHPFQWEAILHYPTAEGHRAVPSSVSRNGNCLHVWLTG